MPGFNRLFYDGRFPGEDLTTEQLNWKDAVLSNGEMKEQVFLPDDYVEISNQRVETGVFPQVRDYVVTGRGTLVALELGNDSKNDGTSLFMKENGYFVLTIYPNIEPFRLWEIFKIITSDLNKEFTILVTRKDGRELYSNTKSVVLDANNDISVEWDLSTLDIGLEEITIRVKANSNNTEINTIVLGFDIQDEGLPALFTRRTIPTRTIPPSALVGTLNFEIGSNLTGSQITQANAVFEEESINGETILLENFPFRTLDIPLRGDFKNFELLTTDNQRIKHYLFNNQGNLGVYIELPYDKLDSGDISLKANIYNRDTVVESSTSIFDYIADARIGRPVTNISKTDYPSVANRTPTNQIINGEQVITTGSYGSEGFRVGNIDYQEINYLVDYEDTTGDTGNHVTFYRGSDVEDQGLEATVIGYEWNNSTFGLWGSGRVTVSNKVQGMHMEALRSPNSGKSWYLHDRLNKPNYSLSTNGFKRQGEYLVFRSHGGVIKIPWVVNMQNPCSSLFNTRFEDKDYVYTPI